ncbi:NLPA lipoprotein [gut metagenome]|uniref:NLPA lipoprotein n=1 Tax=gut metagenome TaxID=749906 RepID=J9GD32_9ZZZZ
MKKIAKFLITTALCALTIFAAGCSGDKEAPKKADPNAPVKIGVTAGSRRNYGQCKKSWLPSRASR